MAVTVFLLISNGLPGSAEMSAVAQARDSLVQEIYTYDPRSTSQTNASGARLSPKAKKNLARESEALVQPLLRDNYSVVSVVPVLKKEKHSGNPSSGSTGTSNDSELRSWLASPNAVDDIVNHAGNSDRTYAWLQTSRPVKLSLMRSALRQFNASVLGSSGDLVRLRVPNDAESLRSILGLTWVSGIGAFPPNQKLSPSFQKEIHNAVSNTQLPVFISVMESELESLFRPALADIGVVVGYFDPTIRVFAAVISPGQIHDLTHLDFVHFVEPIAIVTAEHDTAVPSQGIDKLRTIGSQSGDISGITGTTIPIGLLDTGLNTNHVDISTLRESICGKNFIANEDNDLWHDSNGHGTHVTGTLVGNGFFLPMYAGMAPGVQHIRFAKVLSARGAASTLTILRGMDFLAEESSCVFDGQETDKIRPLIVNVSLSERGLTHDSRSAAARKLDSLVWAHRQLYVVANSNAGEYGYSNYGAAKNSLSVGVALDSGEISGISSHGPTVDNRLTPLVTGTGFDIYSATGNGSFDSYSSRSGTSMASPSVAGLAALLMDASPDHRERPALVRARLMASAIRPNAWFESESQFPRNNTEGPGKTQALYGMGMVSSTTTVMNNDSENGWTSSGASVEMENEEYAYHDIEIPEGTDRLDVVMTWDEPAADAIANNVLNNLDLWIDHGGDCGTGPCGEHSSLSKIDNVEWIIIQNPEPGTYRLKIDANSVYSDAPRAALAWTIIRGDSTPQLTVETNQDVYETPSGENHSHKVDLTVSTDSYVAKGVSLHIDCRTLDGKPCPLGSLDIENEFQEREHYGLVQRSDGLGVAQVGDHFVLGEISEGVSTDVLLSFYAHSSEPMRVYIKALCWNGKSGHTSFLVRPTGSIDEVSVASSPSNDDFENPMVLDESNGNHQFDLLDSSMEQGEPMHEDEGWSEERVAGSVWFQLIAGKSGRASFLATPVNRDFPKRVPRVQVYQSSDACCGVSGAKLLASADWSAQLFVQEGNDYRVRVSVADESLPLAIRWFQGERPINDNFANAIELSGESGEISGNNLGATLEVGELYGYLASSVWYQWTAPEDGQWEFQILDAEVVHILAFVGDDVADLRLVSNFVETGYPITVHAKEDETYRIMVASPNAYSGGWAYDTLTWYKVERSPNSNDMLESATDLGNSELGSVNTSHNNWPGIEPNEPEATGVQSRWWKWQAPQDGPFTFYWVGETDQVAAAFEGSSIGDIQPAMLTDNSTTGDEFVIDANEDEHYWISVGREKFSPHAFNDTWTDGQLKWGKTPSNNTVDLATELVGEQGEVSDTTLYATTERDGWEHLGRSSMWYMHEVAQSGWVKFWIESRDLKAFRLAAFKRKSENSDLEFVMASRRYSGRGDHVVEVVVFLDEGNRALLRIANELRHQEEKYTLRWEATDAPNWLAYVGRLSYGRRDEGGNISRIRAPAEISFNEVGTAAYVSTQDGLHVYRRNPDTGGLTLTKIYEDVPVGSHHIWDPYRSKLYVTDDFKWWTFAASRDDPFDLELVDFFEDEDFWAESSHERGVPTLSLDSNGDYLYRLGHFQQHIYDFSSEGKLRFFGADRDPQRYIFPSYDRHYWYGLNNARSLVYKSVRILGSAFYEDMSESDLPGGQRWRVLNDHSNRFTFIATNNHFRVFDNQAEDGQLTNLTSDYNFASELRLCGSGFARRNRYVVDLICDYGSFVVEYDSDANEAYVTDKIVNSRWNWIPDRFGRSVPQGFALWDGRGIAASPDGHHIYASTQDHGILILERYGSNVFELEVPMRRMDLLHIEDGVVQFGDDSINEGCFDSNSWTVNDTSYTVASSKWQEREEGSEWSDVEGTEITSQLCMHAPIENREYRIVADIEVGGSTNEYSSNFFARMSYQRFDDLVVSSGEVELNGQTYFHCEEVSNTDINGTNYTVFNSKWQSRPDADSVWSDVHGTETSGELCPLDAEEGLMYRLVGSIMVDDERGHRRSNVMQSDSSE